MPEPKDPVRETFTKMARLLERLPEDADKRRVIRAFVVLLDMTPPKES